MACTVFGNPIAKSTLEGMPEYAGRTITRKDRAHAALNLKNAQKKDVNALAFLGNLKQKSGNGIATLCLVYNATGDTVTFATSHNWHGNIGPVPYPAVIANGQWGVFLHVTTAIPPSGSAAAVVYRGKNHAEENCDWMLAWNNPLVYDNTAYTEIREMYHYEDNDYWDYIFGKLKASGQQHTDKWNGCISTVSIGSGTFPIFEAILKLDNTA